MKNKEELGEVLTMNDRRRENASAADRTEQAKASVMSRAEQKKASAVSGKEQKGVAIMNDRQQKNISMKNNGQSGNVSIMMSGKEPGNALAANSMEPESVPMGNSREPKNVPMGNNMQLKNVSIKINQLLKNGESIIRVLDISNGKVFVVDCRNKAMPKWVTLDSITNYIPCADDQLDPLPDINELDLQSRKFTHVHFTYIAGALPFIADKRRRCAAIADIAESRSISRQTVCNYLWLYLAYQNIAALAPKTVTIERELTADEKNIRWALNKYFYTQRKNSLNTAYMLMLKEKYCDAEGVLLPQYPSFYQFRYFYRKHKNVQNYYIAREGLKDYQRNRRPLLGDGIQEFAPAVGVGMLDATVCDIYLVNEAGEIVGRPILTACVDAYSGLCCGYSLSWEGGVYSLRSLMANVIADKVKLCQKHGISISKEAWNCNMLPGTLVTDMGREYVSNTFEQIADLGVTVINLPAYRPELKGAVEKFFDVIQGLYKLHLKGKGVIEPDYQERGAHDYRLDARLTMADFERVILRCIIYYNSQRIADSFPYTEKMLAEGVKPYASAIWSYGLNQAGANLIPVDYDTLILTLLPRTQGSFTRKGLTVNKLRYKCEGFAERYLTGGTAAVAYDPEDVTTVWLIENGVYSPFTLIESSFNGKDISEAEALRESRKAAAKAAAKDSMQAKIDLANHIGIIAASAVNKGNTGIKGIRDNRRREQRKTHIDYIKGGAANE